MSTATSINRQLAAEAIGTALLVATVIGSGIMAERLAGGNDAVALLGNTAATAAMLYVLIVLLGPISGAHFNPIVSGLLGARKAFLPFALVQILAGFAGMLLAHLMFGLDLVQWSPKSRTGLGQWIGELIATFGLLFTIVVGSKQRPDAIPGLVVAWITAGYWFTSSTSFANPAVTIARAFTDSFAGIAPIDVPAFIFAQCVGGWLGYRAGRWLIGE